MYGTWEDAKLVNVTVPNMQLILAWDPFRFGLKVVFGKVWNITGARCGDYSAEWYP